MKHNKFQNQDSGLGVQELFAEVNAVPLMSSETITDLEHIMTNSAFGYEYAKSALDEEGDFGFLSERLSLELESFRETYFDARLKLSHLDENRLKEIEQELKIQKLIVFSSSTTYLN